MADISAGTLYEINQSIMSTQTKMTKKEWDTATKVIKAYFRNNAEQKYFMLLCKEIADYTIFVLSASLSSEIACNELKELITERGEILSIEENDNSAIEIWIKRNDDNTPHAYYLFQYGRAVIEC